MLKPFIVYFFTMNTKVLKTLEFDKIIGFLTEKCATPLGKEMALSLLPMEDFEDIRKAQDETADALSRLYRYGSISCSGARDIRESLLRLKVQANLSMAELLSISVLLKTTERVKSYGRKKEEQEGEDTLEPYFSALSPINDLLREIERCILNENEMADDASANLHSIRRKKLKAADRIRQELNSMVNSNSGYLRENVITQRNGRYCVPVKTEYRGMVPGMIHDESGSGSTVFIEPLSVVKINNEIRELELLEQKEIEAILRDLSSRTEVHIPELQTDLTVLSQLDFIFAKAQLAREMNATRPVFNNERYINIKQGRHPLLPKDSVVPIDIYLGKDFHQLIVTGPNTGGKTVSLKTVGLFSLMGQAGLHIPAFEESSLGIFTEIYADIGDEQSIEQSLSTFSSHMRNIIGILEKADSCSLVLLDELCAGTDPQEGAALAIAILNFLKRMQIRTMATTHYSELKLYALSEEGVENASCEFNVSTLSPTYKLLIGIPGKSNAFAISGKLGLPGYIIDEARQHIDSDTEHFEDVLKDLENTRHRIEKEKMRINELKAEARVLKNELEKENSRLDAQKEKILQGAREEARKLLQEAKDQVDETIRALNKSGNQDVRELERVRTETREKLNSFSEVNKERKEKIKSGTRAKDLHIGDGVHVHSMNLKGTVSTLPDARGNFFVQMGILRSQVHISDVTKLNEATVSYDGKAVRAASGAGQATSIAMSKAATVSAEINLIGMTVDEAMSELDKYLDDAYLSRLPKVRIVHGKGSGALRAAVHQKLKKTKYIDGFHLGEYGEGDSGVTIATFK